MDIAALRELRQTMLRQQRFAEAQAVSARMGKADQKSIEQWRGFLNQAGVAGILDNDRDGVFLLDLKESPIRDLTPLRGMPLTKLNLLGCTNVSDLKPLHGMLLRELNLQLCPVSDLSPLKDMPLIKLFLGATHVTDITPLKGMRLQELMLSDTKISDIGALRRMPLASLNLWGSKVEDISPLQGMTTLGWLGLDHTAVKDIKPLQGSHLGFLTAFTHASIFKTLSLWPNAGN